MLTQASLRNIPTEELRKLNSLVCDEIKDRQRRVRATAAAQFRIGDKVRFWNSKRLTTVTIVIDKVNSQTVNGRCVTTGVGWRVSPNLLEAAS